MSPVARIIRRSASFYEVLVDGQPVGAGNALLAAKILACRHTRVRRWARTRREEGVWVSKVFDLARRTDSSVQAGRESA